MRNRSIILLAIVAAIMAGTPHLSARIWEAIPKQGLPGISVIINDARIRRVGTDVVLYPVWSNSGQKDVPSICVDANPAEGNKNASIDGEPGYGFYMEMKDRNFMLRGDEPVGNMGFISRVPLNATTISSLNIVGRTPGSQFDTKANPYGKFSYRFTNIPIPSFNESNWAGCYFTDTDITLEMVKQEAVGKDLVFECVLTNEGEKDKSLYAQNFGKGTVRTIEGEALTSIIECPDRLASGDSAKLRLTIKDGAGEMFKNIRSAFSMSEPGMSYDSEIIIRPRN